MSAGHSSTCRGLAHSRSVIHAILIAVIAAGLAACGSTAFGPGSSGITQLKTPLATPTPIAGTFSTYAIPSANTYLGGMTKGQDGNLWVTEGDADKIAQVTTTGTVTEFPVPTAGAYPGLIRSGPDGNLWFTELGANNIGQSTLTGAITEFPFTPPPGAVAGLSNGQDITTGPDGNLWFTFSGNTLACGGDTSAGILVMSPSGTLLATYTTPTQQSGPEFIVAGPDGKMLVAEVLSMSIARVTMSGVITEYPLPTRTNGFCAGQIGGMTVGPDGNIWFTERWANKIGRITTAGVVTEFGPFATGDMRFQRIIAGDDGNLWFAEAPIQGATTNGIIAKMDTSGNLLEEFSWSNGGPRAMAVGGDREIWYTDESLDVVGKLVGGASRVQVTSVKRFR